jgi:hypothetical protein
MRISKIVSFSVVILLITVLFAAAVTVPAAAQTTTKWRYETVDSGGVGTDTSLALDAAGNPHISYYDAANKAVKYAAFSETSWDVQTVHASRAGGTSLALDTQGRPHISYPDTQGLDYTLGYSYVGGTSWNTATIDSVSKQGYIVPNSLGEGSSLALDAAGNAHISYHRDENGGPYDITIGGCMYAYYDGTASSVWSADDYNGAYYTSLALNSTGQPRISYYGTSYFYGDNLCYVRDAKDGRAWSYVDQTGNVGLYTSLKLDSSDNPHISYYDAANRTLKYASYNGTGWKLETVDSGGVGNFTSLALDAAGHPHISYYDGTHGDLKHAWYDGTKWNTETLDSVGDVGQYTSIAIDAAGYIHISYYDATNHALKYATTAPAPKTTLSCHAPASAYINQNFAISGQLIANGTALTNGKVTLQRSPSGASWSNVTNTTTNGAGNYSFTRSEATGGTIYYRAAYAGDAHHDPANSSKVAVTIVIPLGQALDNSALTWTTGSSTTAGANWFGQGTTWYYGGSAAQSAKIYDNGNTWLHTTVTGPGKIAFYWKVSSESGYDWLNFTVDGVSKDRISGSPAWAQENYTLASGTHTLEWRYTKDVSLSAGADAGWVDKVQWTDLRTPTALTATVNASQVKPKQNFTISGRLTSNGTGVGWTTLTLQRSTDNKTFANLQSITGSGSSYYTFSRNESAAGTYYYRTTYPGTATYANATSNVVKVTVT